MFSARTLISRPILASAASAVATSSARTAFRTARPTIAASAAVVPSARRLYHEKDMASLFFSYRQLLIVDMPFYIKLHLLTVLALIDHYTRPRNVGSLDRKDPSVGSGLVGAPACGDVMKLDIRVDPVTNKIIEAKFKTFGCGSAIASSSYLTTLVQGKSLDDAAAIRNVDIASELCLPPVKLHCSMLAEDAIKAAVADYRSKRPQTNLGGTGKTISQAPPAPQAAAAAI